MVALAQHGAVNWMGAIRGASDRLFTVLCKTSTALLKDHHVDEALAESVLDCVKELPGYIWNPQNGKSYIATTVLVLTCGSGMDWRQSRDENNVH